MGATSSSHLEESAEFIVENDQIISKNKVDAVPRITNMNGLFNDLYIRYIALKREDFTLYYKVFCKVHDQMQERMKVVDSYYKKYSSRKQIAGSNFDKVRIKKPDEFDMDIVIGLPVDFDVNPLKPDESDIIFENASAGYIQLKMGVQFKKLPVRDREEWLINKTAYEWADEKGYLLRSKFIYWFKSVVKRALNTFDKFTSDVYLITIDGIEYTIHVKDGILATNFIIQNKATGFKLDIDFVPAMKFPESRWPINKSYRAIPPGCGAEDWMLVPKLNKLGENSKVQDRAWRLALHNQEKRIMHNYCHLKQAFRFMKKLRDAQEMHKIASYHIKTLFLWEIVERNDPAFWSSRSPSEIFKMMVDRLHAALVCGKIPFFWNRSNNLIGGLPRELVSGYAARLARLRAALAAPARWPALAEYILTPDEHAQYKMMMLNV